MSISIFDTRKLVQVITYLHAVRTPLLDLFFRNTDQSQTKYIDLDFVRNSRRLAPFVGPTMEGQMIDKSNWETKSLQPPYIKIKDVTTAVQILKRQPGQTIYQKAKSPQQQARIELAKGMKKFMDMIQRRTEHMAHAVLSTQGDVTFSGNGVSVTIDFGMRTTHDVTLTGNDVWSDTTNSHPLKDINDWATIIKKDSGLAPDTLVLDTDAAQEFLDHPEVGGASNTSVFHTNRVDLGMIKPKELPSGLTYIGTLRRPNVDIYEYNEYYENASGTVTPIMTSGTIIMGTTKAQTILHYGAIEDLDATGAVPFFPKSWAIKDPSAQILLVQSAPLPAPHQIDAFFHATI